MASEEKPQREPATHLVIVPHTHWDREWYRPFEAFRHRLVHLVDTLLDILESDPAFLFHFDGQTIVLDDYLAIRPQNEDRLRRHLQSGRIRIGPWRVLPDQFLVTGESLIRNLQQGHADCARWGVQPSAVGYAPDMFGHAAATPQVFAGFGIDCAVVWRGVGPDVRDTRFMWQGADGSRLFTIYLADSYSNGANLPTNGDALMARLDEIRAAQRDFCHIPPLLIMNGSDHLEPQPAIPALMDAVVARRPDWTWELASIESFVEMARGHAGDLPLHVGELRHPWRANILPGVTSVRSYQKQADFMASRLLEKYVEPLTAWAQQLGGDRGNADFTAYAWRLLTENHPHDSICGCSVDAVHDEMDTRYEKVMQLGLTLQNDAISQLAEALDAASLATGFEQALVTYTAARPALQLLDTALYLPDPDAFRALQDAAGRLHPIQLTPVARELLFEVNLPADALKLMVQGMEGRTVMDYTMNDLFTERNGRHLKLTLICAKHRYGDVDIEAKKTDLVELLDSETIETVRVVGQSATKARLQAVLPVSGQTAIDGFAQVATAPGDDGRMLCARPGCIETGAFAVQVDDDGTVSIEDKRGGRTWRRALRLVDEGDRGDTYNFDPVEDGPVIDTPVRPVEHSVLADGPVAATIAVEAVYSVPASLTEDRLGRSTRCVDLPVHIALTCYRDLDRIDVLVKVDNRCRDHRLRAVMELPFKPRESIAEGSFGIVRRGVDLYTESDTVEKPYRTAPMKTFVCVEDERGGIALLTRGIPEYEVKPGDNGGELALTLQRCVGWLSRDDLEMRNRNGAGPALETPGAQSLRTQSFEFAVLPYGGSFDAAGVSAEAHAYAFPPIATQTGRHSGALGTGSQLVAPAHPDTVVSAITPSHEQEHLAIRLYNTSEVALQDTITFAEGAVETIEVNLLDQPVADMQVGPHGHIEAAFAPSQVRTWRVRRPRTS